MRIDVTPGGEEEVALHDPEDFKAFSVLIEGDGPAGEALAGLGRVDDDREHVHVDPEVLLRLAGDRANDPSWRESLDAMIAFAAKHGWVDESGFIRAHIEQA